jgi:hypothetical protein
LIYDQIGNGHTDYFDLLEFVKIEFLPKEMIQQYFKLVCDHFDQFNVNHWNSLQWKLLGEFRESDHSRRLRKQFAPNSDTKGIIWHLTTVCGGNVHEQKEVIVTASSVHTNGGRAKWEEKHAVDYNIETHFHADGKLNDWICFDFRKRTIVATHYSICAGWQPIGSWRLEGSMDGNQWIPLDVRENDIDLKADRSSRTFPVLKSTLIRMIRLTQTGPACWFMLRRFEVFGLLIEMPFI